MSKRNTITASYPNPETTNDYWFLEFVRRESVFFLEGIYKDIKKRKLKLKPQFKEAIIEKIQNGSYENPYTFYDYFGTQFDLIGVDFYCGTEDLLSAFQIGVCFVQNEKIAYQDYYNFQPPEKFLESEKFKKTVNLLNEDLEMINDLSFEDVWISLELGEYLNDNLLVFWNRESEILKQVLNYNKIKGYNLRYITVREIAMKNELPDLLDSLLEHYNSDYTLEDRNSLLAASLYYDLKESEIDLDIYEQRYSDLNSKTQSKNSISNTRFPFNIEGHETLSGDILRPDLKHADPNNPLYAKKVVFTGMLSSINRADAAEAVKKLGADINTSISKKTNYVIIGVDPGPSKMNRIIECNNNGGSIKLLYEQDLLELIN